MCDRFSFYVFLFKAKGINMVKSITRSCDLYNQNNPDCNIPPTHLSVPVFSIMYLAEV